VISAPRKLRQEDESSKPALYYIVRPVSKKQKKPGVAAHIYDPNTQEAKAGGPQVQGQPRLQSKIQSQKKKKKERKKEERQRGVWRRKVGSSSDYDYHGKNLSS
jgi:hypothetical protein